MRLRYLSEFIVLARVGNFRAGSKELFISCTTLSNHMRALEQEIGFKLFDRESGNRITKAGYVFLEAATTMLDTIDSGLEKCCAAADSRGYGEEVVNISLRNSLNELCPMLEASCPCKYSYVEYESNRPILHSFAQGATDVMVVYSLDIVESLRLEALNLGLQYEPYGSVPCAVVMEKTNPLASGPLTRDRLRGVEVVQLNAVESDAWKIMISEMLGDDLDLRFRLIPIGNIMNFRLIDLEGAVFISLRPMLDQYFSQRDDCVVRGLVDGEPLILPRSLVYRAPSEKPGIAAVLETFRAHLSSI